MCSSTYGLVVIHILLSFDSPSKTVKLEPLQIVWKLKPLQILTKIAQSDSWIKIKLVTANQEKFHTTKLENFIQIHIMRQIPSHLS
jgi:hypothetical protein